MHSCCCGGGRRRIGGCCFLLLLFGASCAHALVHVNNDNWLTERLQPFDLQVQEFPHTGRGIQTIVDRRAQSVILQVPDQDAWTIPRALDQFPELLDSDGDRSVCLWDEQILAYVLCHLDEKDSFYLKSLPTKQYSVVTLPSSIIECLPRCHQETIKATQSFVQQLYQELIPISKTNLKYDTFAWAFATVRSRSLAASEIATPGQVGTKLPVDAGSLVLLPVLDLLNHSPTAMCTLNLKNSIWELTSMLPYKAGDQVFLDYGGHRDAWKMFLNYGFADPQTPLSCSWLDIANLVQATAVVYPDIITPRVASSIQGKLETQLGAAAQTPEDRPMFKFDGSRLPFKGADYMAQVVQQVAATTTKSPVGDNPSQRILTQLLSHRRDECQLATAQLSSYEMKQDTGWQPTIDCLKQLMQQEYDFLNAFLQVQEMLEKAGQTGEMKGKQ